MSGYQELRLALIDRVEVSSSSSESILIDCPLCRGPLDLFNDEAQCGSGCNSGDVLHWLRETVRRLPGKCPKEGSYHAPCGHCSDRDAAMKSLARDKANFLRGGFEAAVADAVFRAKVKDEADRVRAERSAEPLADEWFGATGDQFNPETPEPVPCALEFAEGEFAFRPGIHPLFGARGTLKTWLAYKAVVQEAERGNYGLIIDYELSFEEAMRRCLALGATRWTMARIVYVQPSGAISDSGRARLLERFGATPPTVVVIDSQGMGMAVAGLDENSGTASAQWSIELPSWLKRQWPKAVILPIDHLPKASKGNGSDPIGSQRKGAIADGLWLVQKLSDISRTTRGRGRLIVQKDRQGFRGEGQPVLDFEFGGGGDFVLSAPDKNEAVADAMQGMLLSLVRIAEYVWENPGVKVEAARTDLDIHPNTFTTLKNMLVDDGVIEHKAGKGLFPGEEMETYLAENT